MLKSVWNLLQNSYKIQKHVFYHNHTVVIELYVARFYSVRLLMRKLGKLTRHLLCFELGRSAIRAEVQRFGRSIELRRLRRRAAAHCRQWKMCERVCRLLIWRLRLRLSRTVMTLGRIQWPGLHIPQTTSACGSVQQQRQQRRAAPYYSSYVFTPGHRTCDRMRLLSFWSWLNMFCRT